MNIARLPKTISLDGRIAQWFCEQHPDQHLIFIRNCGQPRAPRCLKCERYGISWEIDYGR